ncbi:hypothetical protein COCMIDRAFT_102731 [Bipolaris oryzae ATCC 44560]|uniref:Uncharacterized protein n=1 Tax=Bipolaris oryzae ATCC 44560 TaxID=930090 RepID=W6ZGV4_COCMI|nr:uncharacterized protein COCMIDRAFT_102731 [Bipolaris oryzae ATCC 44560]EUC42736.1 hypothetical protein COCMIDRAFT_102731 [Bipolaris oryzae ATCC 44560]
MHLSILAIIFAISAPIVSGNGQIQPGLGCVCMGRASKGQDQANRDRTQITCDHYGGLVVETANFYNRGKFYCAVPNSVTPAIWDQQWCRKYWGATYGYCNERTAPE